MTAPAVVNDGVELVAIGQVEPHPDNPRRGDVEAIRASIDHNGFYGTIVVQRSTRRILAGNHRYRAAVDAGIAEIPVAWVDVDDETALRILVADNRTNDLATYDDEALVALLTKLTEGAGLGGSGYDGDDLDDLLRELGRGPAGVDDPDVPLPAEPISRRGELYELGGHRLMCGDCTEPEDVAALFAGAIAQMVWTDPPYGVEYVGKTPAALTILGDSPDGTESLIVDMCATVGPCVEPGAAFYLASTSGPQGTRFRVGLERAGWRLHQSLVWCKDRMVLGHSDYHYQHEDLLYGWLPGPGRSGRGAHAGTHWYGGDAETSVFHVDRPSRNAEHPTSKPVELILPHLRNSSRAGDVVADPFAGSGSALVACEVSGRRCFAMEKDPRYCDVIRNRYAALVGDESLVAK